MAGIDIITTYLIEFDCLLLAQFAARLWTCSVAAQGVYRMVPICFDLSRSEFLGAVWTGICIAWWAKKAVRVIPVFVLLDLGDVLPILIHGDEVAFQLAHGIDVVIQQINAVAAVDPDRGWELLDVSNVPESLVSALGDAVRAFSEEVCGEPLSLSDREIFDALIRRARARGVQIVGD